MSKLNKDILFLLFEGLQDDSKSLFSCLMVNKRWCETVIPILWRNPWRYAINYNKNSLYYIITFYLADNIKESLTTKEIQFLQTPLFDYLSFCRSINMNVIDSIISIGSSAYNQSPLQQEIYSLLMRKCLEIKYFDMRSIKLSDFPEEPRLNSLCELKCDISINSSYIHGLARVCQYIQRLIIINNSIKVNDEIVELIKVQKNLKYFEWKDSFDRNYFTNPYKKTFLELAKKADTLNHLIMSFQFIDYNECSFPQNLLAELYGLRTLKINIIKTSNDEEQLKKLVYRDLEILNINCIGIHTANCIIKNSGGNLREILLEYDDYLYESNFNEVSFTLIRTIYENCPLVEYLSLVLSSSKEHFIEFENLLKACQKLKSLLLIMKWIDYENELNPLKTNEEKFADGEELLKVLNRSAPTSLREIRFFDHFKFSLKTLEAFLIKWEDRTALSMLTSDPLYEEDNYIKLINKYKNDGVIKDFRIDSEMNVYF